MLNLTKVSNEKLHEFSNEQIADFTKHLSLSVADKNESARFMGFVKQVDDEHYLNDTVTFIPSHQDKDIIYLIKTTAQKTTTLALSRPVLLARYLTFHNDEILECLLDSLAGVGLHGVVFRMGNECIRVSTVDFVNVKVN